MAIPMETSGTPSTPVLLALDLGTTTCRSVLFDLAGQPLAEAACETPARHPQPRWAEVDPERWWENVCLVTRRVLHHWGGDPRRIVAVGLAGLMHAPVLLGHDGRPVYPAMLWMDQRCAAEAEWMRRELAPILERSLGSVRASTTVTAPKLRWLAVHRPDVLAATHVVLLPKDYIRFRLTGHLGTDPSDAGGTGMYSQAAGGWAVELAVALGLRPEQLPPIVPSTKVVGKVTGEAAEATGLAEGTPVVTGMSDVRATITGAGPFAPGEACLYLGTAAWITVPQPAPGAARRSFGSTSTTGAAVRWMAHLLEGEEADRSPADAYARLTTLAEQAPPGAGGLLFLPHLMGERGFRPHPQASGLLFGLALAHGRPHLARAVLEGTAHHLRATIEHADMPSPPVIVTVGGGARSPLWCQIIADTINCRLEVPRVVEAGALGAAICAAVGAGLFPDTEAAARQMVRRERSYAPDPSRHARYSRLHRLWLDLEERVQEFYGLIG
jgi:xylulokinase